MTPGRNPGIVRLPVIRGKRSHPIRMREERRTMAGKGSTTRYTRRTKQTSDRKRREKVHRARLVSLGMSEAEVTRLNPKEVRILLQRPCRVKKA